jgi:hypothetical protein
VKRLRTNGLGAFLLTPDERYLRVAALFLRLLALIYLAAFLSTALEIEGLVGAGGILPAGEHLARLEQVGGTLPWLRFPTLFWIDHGDATLLAAAYTGCFFAVLLLLGFHPLLSSMLLFALYLSLYRVGQEFFNFQWDYLLLEAGFLAIFLTAGPNRLLVFLFHWLLFRLRFLSGLSKVLSGDPTWRELTTLEYYFETQPLPHIGSWYAHHLPEALLRAGTGLTLVIELLVPFFIFLPRPFRIFAALSTILLQLVIIATSNHNFINLLTIALCLFLLDDRAIKGIVPEWLSGRLTPARWNLLRRSPLILLAGVLLASSTINAYLFIADRRDELSLHSPLNWARAWGLGNVYHVFPSMQTERQELMIEGSHDGRNWTRYRFRYKPNTTTDRPRFIVPLHPRLDWMMWFVPAQNPAMRPWFERFMWRLSENSPAVTGLLATNPFADAPPRYLRVLAYRYRFTTPAERGQSGKIWHGEYLGEFPRVPPRRP